METSAAKKKEQLRKVLLSLKEAIEQNDRANMLSQSTI